MKAKKKSHTEKLSDLNTREQQMKLEQDDLEKMLKDVKAGIASHAQGGRPPPPAYVAKFLKTGEKEEVKKEPK